MKFTIGTAKMNSILGKLSKGVGNSKILPITEYIKFELVEGTLTMVATNSANFITYTEKEVEGEDGIAIVKADMLIKLVARTSKPEIHFELKDTHLEVKGNGTYKLELFETNEYPEYEFDTTSKGITVKTALLKRAFEINKSAIATEMLMPCLTGYNIGNDVITTDGVKMCLNDTTIFQDVRTLIPQGLADLLTVLSDEEVTIQKDGNKLLFTTSNITVFGTELDGIEEYPDISVVTDIHFPNYGIVSRQQLIDTLDRLSLFIDNSTNYGVKMTFKQDGLYVEDLKKKSTEKIEYVERSQEQQDVELIFNINYLDDLVSALGKENLTVYYGEELPIKLVEENVTLVLSTMSQEG